MARADASRIVATVASGGAQHRVGVDSSGAHVVSQEQPDRPGVGLAELSGATISAAQALDAAIRQEPEARFDGLQIDTDDAGAVIWQVSLVRLDGADAVFNVDAQSGAATPAK